MSRAFVIQLRPGAKISAAQFAGRVEHIDSGRADHFRSVKELLSFIEQTLAEIEQGEQGESQTYPPS